MKRFSPRSLVLVSALVLILLSGCIARTGSISFHYQQGDTLNGSEQLYVRYSDGAVTNGQSFPSNQTQLTIQTDSEKTIVGGYVSTGNISWVPKYSYGSGVVSLSGISAQKPAFPVDHVIQAGQPVKSVHPGFVEMTFAVYGTNGELVNGQTEVFAHSADPDLTFYNTDPMDKSYPGSYIRTDHVTEGYSSYTINGLVTFVIQADISDISSTPLSLYSGSKLIYDSKISPVIQSLAIGFASGDSENNVTQNMTLPTSGENDTNITWVSSNPEVVSTTGIVHAPSLGSGDANVTMTASVYSNSNLFLSKSFNLLVKESLPNDDASLNSLIVSGITLDQSFSSNVYDYTATAPNDISVTTVTYSTDDSQATAALQRNGTLVNNPISLNVGLNIISIVVTAQDGSKQTYTVTVTRDAPTVSLTGLALTPSSLSIQVGSSATTVAMATYSDNSSLNVTKYLAWTFSNSGVASIENGVVNGINAGTTVATATYGGTSAQLNIIVTLRSSSGEGGSNPSPSPGPGSGSGSSPTLTPTPMKTPDLIPVPTELEPSPFVSSVVTDVGKIVSRIKEMLEANKDGKVTFSDTTSHWASKDIAMASRLHIIEGYQNGSFNPNASVSRAEFSAMITRAFGLTATSIKTSFSDMEKGNWSQSYIEILASNGIINGYEDGTFQPNKDITRAEMLTVISRILNVKELSKNGSIRSFADVDNGYWAKETIEQATGAGIINGVSTDKFAPENNATRAEALTLIIRSLKTDKVINELLK